MEICLDPRVTASAVSTVTTELVGDIVEYDMYLNALRENDVEKQRRRIVDIVLTAALKAIVKGDLRVFVPTDAQRESCPASIT